MRIRHLLLAATMLASFHTRDVRASEPDYSTWERLLKKYYSPASGMDYAHLKAQDSAALESVRTALGKVDAASLTPKERLAYWINVYNVNVVATVVEKYPIRSIRDLSTDFIVRLNVFKTPRVPSGNGRISLNDVENTRIRDAFHDPRIHFAINCAARSCPPIRTEPYTGAQLDAQLDDQARKFLNGPMGVRFHPQGKSVELHVTKIMDWFGKDFESWARGRGKFIERYLTEAKAQELHRFEKISFAFDDYDWSLNDWKR